MNRGDCMLKKVGLIPKLLIGIVLGFAVGQLAPHNVVAFFGTAKSILGSIVFFVVPLVILGFVTPAITGLKNNASKMLGAFLSMSYLSAVGASIFAAVMGYLIVPKLGIHGEASTLLEAPKFDFTLAIEPVMPVMTALILAIFIGLTVIWTDARRVEALLNEGQQMIMALINKVIIPILPVYIFSTFVGLSYTGIFTEQLPTFFKMIVLALVGHAIWLTVLYSVAGIVSGVNPLKVVRHYLPAYLTAMGTMSSAATLPVAIQCAKKSEVLPDEVVDFAIPLGATTHLSGSVLTETFFCMTIAQMLYGQMPSIGAVVTFAFLFGIFAIGAPGVPGGTVMASLAIVFSVLGFDETGVGLLIAVFAIQDSFGTAANITGDGALALMLKGLFYRKSA